MSNPETAAEHLDLKGRISDIQPFGAGNINQTFLLTTVASEKVIFQKINASVFKHPQQIMENLARVLGHMEKEIAKEQIPSREWQQPRIIKFRDEQDYYVDGEGNFWRGLSCIDQVDSFETVASTGMAEKAGRALGRFHRLSAGLDPGSLHDVLPGFHETPTYVQQYYRIRLEGSPRRTRENSRSEACANLIEKNRHLTGILEDAKQSSLLQVRTIHGDPKISNILFSKQTGDPVSLIDLDTVKPGLLQYDIGDFFRSACNPAGEETTDPGLVSFSIERFKSGWAGYLLEMGNLLTEADVDYIFDSIRLMTLELGIRFFADYLAGDVYFKTSHETHNLQRAEVQFRLFDSIMEQEAAMRGMINKISGF